MAEKFELKAIISAVDKMTPALKGIRRGVRLTHKTIKDIGREGRNLMSSFGLPAGLAFGAVAYGAVRAARAAMEYAGSIQDATDRSGAAIEPYQAMVNMLGQVGGSAEDAGVAFKTFGKGAATAAAGADKNFAGLMKKLNIPLKDAKGQVRGLMDVLPELADGFAKNTNPATRTRMATELFGKSGTKLIPILAKGSAAMKLWIAEQKRLGLIVDKDSIGALDDLGDSLDVVKTQIRAQLAVALAKLVPVIQPIIKSMTEWIAANKELIQAKVVEVVKEVAAAIKKVDWVAFIKGVKGTVNSVREFVAEVGGMKNIVIGLGLAWIAGPVAAVLSIGGAVARAIVSLGLLLFSVKSTATGYTVMGAIPAINAALGASFVWLRTQALAAMLVLRMGGVAGLATVALQSIMAGVAATGTALMGAGKAVLLFSRALLLSPLGIVMALATAAYLVYKNWDKLKSWFGQFWEWIKTKAASIGAIMAKALSPLAAGKWLANKAIELTAPSTTPQKAAQTPLERSGALQLASGRQQLTGDMTVRFENAPPGMRVDPGKTNQPGVSMNPDVGYRSLAMGF